MSSQLPNGSVLSIASAYATSKVMSAISNATEAVATLAASHGVLVGDIVEITSGWGKLSNRIARVKTVATNDVTLELIDTSSTTRFPAGAGAGSVRVISTWVVIPQVMEFNGVGGEQQYQEFQFLEDTDQRSQATVRSAQGLDLAIADDNTLACYTTLRAADIDRLQRALRLVLPNANIIYYDGTVTFNDNPKLSINNINQVASSVRFTAPITRYNS